MIIAANMKIGKPLPNSIATLSLGPEGPVLTEGVPYRQHVASPLPSVSKAVRVARSGEFGEENDTEAQLLIETSLEGHQEPGELSLYADFIKICGRFGLLIFVFLLAIFIVGVTYPRESSLIHNVGVRSRS